MERIESKITSQGQVSVPARIRQKLGLTPGGRMEWCERGEEVLVRRAKRYSSEDIHAALFPSPPATRDLQDMEAGIQDLLRRKHAGG